MNKPTPKADALRAMRERKATQAARPRVDLAKLEAQAKERSAVAAQRKDARKAAKLKRK